MSKEQLNLSEIILREIGNLVLVADENANIIYVSPSVKSLLGYEPIDLLAWGWWEMRKSENNRYQEEIDYVSSVAKGATTVRTEPYENQILDINGTPKWISWHDSVTLDGKIIGVGNDITALKKENLARKAISRIAEESTRSTSEEALFSIIAEEVLKVIPTQNIYLALHEKNQDVISFPVYIDQKKGETNYILGKTRPFGKGITEYALLHNQPLFLQSDDLEAFANDGKIEIRGEIPKIWMCAPLRYEHQSFGLIALQNYQNQNALNNSDLEILELICLQVAAVLKRLEAERALRESEEHFRMISEATFGGICFHQNGLILEVNPALANMFGYLGTEMTGRSIYQFLEQESRQIFERETSAHIGIPFEVIGIRKDGNTFHLEAVGKEHTLRGEIVQIAALRDITERKLAEEAQKKTESLLTAQHLIESEKRFRGIFEQSPDAMFVEDEQGIILDVNEAACRLHGLSKELLIGACVFELIPEAHRKNARETFKKWFSGEIETLESYTEHSSGRQIPVELRSSKIVFEGKKAVIFQVRDLTDRKKAQKSLESSVAILRSSFELSNDGILVVSKKGKILSYNEKFLEIWNITEQELIDDEETKSFDYATKLVENPAEFVSKVKELNDTPSLESFEMIHFRDQRIFERHSKPLIVGDLIEGRVWFYRDITERTRISLALKDNESKYRMLFSQANDAICILRDQQIIECNEKMLEMFTCQLEELLGLTPFELSPETQPDETRSRVKMLRFINKALSDQPQFFYWRWASYNRVEFDGEVSLNKIYIQGIPHIQMIIRDITERKQYENELVKRNFELDNFVYRASHDLKAPLNSVMGLISLIESEKPPAFVTNYIGLMKKSVTKLDGFIRDLTDYSRNTRLEITGIPLDFEELIKESLENLQHMENAEKVKINTRINQPFVFYSDAFRTSIVINNLISNALKYQDLKKEKQIIEIVADVFQTRVEIQIKDNGIGIPQLHQAHIFEMFYRASYQSFGSGLGLYIVKNAVDKLGGTISFESEEGKGTTFYVSLPSRPPKPEE